MLKTHRYQVEEQSNQIECWGSMMYLHFVSWWWSLPHTDHTNREWRTRLEKNIQCSELTTLTHGMNKDLWSTRCKANIFIIWQQYHDQYLDHSRSKNYEGSIHLKADQSTLDTNLQHNLMMRSSESEICSMKRILTRLRFNNWRECNRQQVSNILKTIESRIKEQSQNCASSLSAFIIIIILFRQHKCDIT